MSRTPTAILISGRGSNMKALLEAAADPVYPARIVHVISNVPEAPGLALAEKAGVPTQVIDHRRFPDRAAFDGALSDALVASGAELVCLAGFMRLLGDAFVRRWQDRVINIHPSLLPAFRGLHTHERALETGVRFAGCTVHFVRPAMDDGPIIAQAAVPVHSDDTADTLGARVLTAEHRLYPLALKLVASGQARVRGSRVVLAPEVAVPVAGCVNPWPDGGGNAG